MTLTLRVDLLRRLYRRGDTEDALRAESGAGLDAALAESRRAGDVVDAASATYGGATSTSATVRLSRGAREGLEELATYGGPGFLEPEKDDVGRRFALTLSEYLPPEAAGAARHVRQVAARYGFERGDFRAERRKAVALVASLVGHEVVELLRRTGEDVAADARAGVPLGDPPTEAGVVAALIRETYALLLTGPGADFARACADAAESLDELYAPEAHELDATRRLAESLGMAFARLVENRLAAAGEAFGALTAIEAVA